MQSKTNQTIIVGMDGGYESAVTAYLLKKQGLSPVGVAVTFHESDPEFKNLTAAFVPDSLERIKEICQILEIPFYATNASESYFMNVVDGILGARLTGNYYLPNIDRTKVIIETLISKMQGLGASMVATGHYCKLLKNPRTNQIGIHRANDLAEDDSFYLAKINSSLLEHLVLPLSDLLQNEVEKISKLIPYKFAIDKFKRRLERSQFMESDDLRLFVEKYSSEKLRKDGQVINFYEGSVIGDHLGIHQFYLGQKKIPLKTRAQVDKDLVVTKVFPPGGVIYLDKESRLKFTHIYVKKFVADKDLNRATPMNAFAMLAPRGEVYTCQIFFKNNNFLFVKFDEAILGLCPRGTQVIFLNKKSAGAKVYGAGTVHSSGFLNDDEVYVTMLKTKSQEEDVEENKQKKKDLGF